MAARTLPSQAYLRQWFEYDAQTGILRWRSRPVDHFGRDQDHRTWNARFAGEKAGSLYSQGNLIVHLGRGIGKAFVHRIVWKLVHDEEPFIIDHIDGDRSNNRLSNLRNVTPADNQKNRKCNHNSKSGVPGVVWSEKRRKWHVRIHSCGVKYHIGSFDNFDEAVAARRAGEIAHGYHPNHGRA